jgi:hypothetical protein
MWYLLPSVWKALEFGLILFFTSSVLLSELPLTIVRSQPEIQHPSPYTITNARATIRPLFLSFYRPKISVEPIFKFLYMSGVLIFIISSRSRPFQKYRNTKNVTLFLEIFTLTSEPCLHISVDSGIMVKICLLTARLWYRGK